MIIVLSLQDLLKLTEVFIVFSQKYKPVKINRRRHRDQRIQAYRLLFRRNVASGSYFRSGFTTYNRDCYLPVSFITPIASLNDVL